MKIDSGHDRSRSFPLAFHRTAGSGRPTGLAALHAGGNHPHADRGRAGGNSPGRNGLHLHGDDPATDDLQKGAADPRFFLKAAKTGAGHAQTLCLRHVLHAARKHGHRRTDGPGRAIGCGHPRADGSRPHAAPGEAGRHSPRRTGHREPRLSASGSRAPVNPPAGENHPAGGFRPDPRNSAPPLTTGCAAHVHRRAVRAPAAPRGHPPEGLWAASQSARRISPNAGPVRRQSAGHHRPPAPRGPCVRENSPLPDRAPREDEILPHRTSGFPACPRISYESPRPTGRKACPTDSRPACGTAS